MDLLDLARGPFLAVAITVFVAGCAWRLLNLWRQPARPDRSPPRDGAPGPAAAALGSILRGLWPRRDFGPQALASALNAWVMHLGMALVFFGYAPHIAFVHRLTGLSWPALPDPVMYLAAAATIFALGVALWARLDDRVLRRISGPGDYLSWLLTFLPFATGMAVAAEPSSALLAHGTTLYRLPLALHLMSLELLLLWFPFGKLMHAFLYPLSRAVSGMRLGHRGVAA